MNSIWIESYSDYDEAIDAFDYSMHNLLSSLEDGDSVKGEMIYLHGKWRVSIIVNNPQGELGV